ncbi:MAG: cation:proton antiporter family protein [Myxococcota bacterium]
MELRWIGVAFAFGLLARGVGQTAAIGFLAAGFVLEELGVVSDQALRELADLGVTLLLFTIGLKLDLRTLARPHVSGLAIAHLGLSTLVAGGVFFALGAGGITWLEGASTAALAELAFATAFSSTVIASKLLEERKDLGAVYGRAAIGVLVVQDLAAVLFLAAREGKAPEPAALLLLLLPAARPLLARLLDFTGHGVLLVLAGLTAALGFGALFAAVGLKAALGALLGGVLLAGSPKGKELARALLPFRDFFLVGFFLSVGLSGLPTWTSVAVAATLLLVLPFKAALFWALGLALKLRARTAFLLAGSLAQLSEFGLIVLAALYADGAVPTDWLTGFALAFAVSCVLSELLGRRTYGLWERHRARLMPLARSERLPEERPVDVRDASVLVFGLGRIGTSALRSLERHGVGQLVGFDNDPDVVDAQRAAGRRVYLGSPADPDLFERLHLDPAGVRWVLLALSSGRDHLNALEQLRHAGFTGRIAVVARYDDELPELEAAGANVAVPVYAEAGVGLATHVIESH